MPLCSSDQLSIRVGRKTESPQRYALIDLDMVPDVARFPDYHTCSVVDKERFADGCTGMDIDPRLLVSPLRHHPWDEWDCKVHEFVSNSVNRDRFQAREAENNFVTVRNAGVAIISRLNVLGQSRTQVRNSFSQSNRNRLPLGLVVNGIIARVEIWCFGINLVGMEQCASDLGRQSIVQ